MRERFYIPQEKINDTGFRVVLCEHYNDNAQEVASHLTDCDIVAVECVAAKSTEVPIIEAGLDAILAGDGSMVNDDHPARWTFADVLAREMAGSCKTMHIIDARLEDKAIFDYDHWIRVAGIRRQPEHNLGAVDVAEREIDELMRYIGESSVARERLVVEQLNQLAETYEGQTIGVVVGYAHTAIPRLIGEDYQTARIFAIPGLSIDAPSVIYPPGPRLARSYTFGASEKGRDDLRRFALAAHLARAAGVSWGAGVWYDVDAVTQLINDYVTDSDSGSMTLVQ